MNEQQTTGTPVQELTEEELLATSEKRRMPEYLRKTMIRVPGGKLYLMAAYRLVWMRDEQGDTWSVETELVEGGQEAGFATVKATVRNQDARILATAHKTETKADFPAGWVEKAESGSISRALSFCGYGTQFDETILGDGLDHGRISDSPHPQRAQQTTQRTQGKQASGQQARPAAPPAQQPAAAATGQPVQPGAQAPTNGTHPQISLEEGQKLYAQACMEKGWDVRTWTGADNKFIVNAVRPEFKIGQPEGKKLKDLTGSDWAAIAADKEKIPAPRVATG